MNHDLAVLATGIALGMLYFQRTGFSPGGIISPGILALNMYTSHTFLWSSLFALVLFLLLDLSVRFFGIYGRQRVALALLLAAVLRLLFGDIMFLDPAWLGWVVPGLVAADIQRQGALPTLAGLLAVSGTTFLIGGVLP